MNGNSPIQVYEKHRINKLGKQRNLKGIDTYRSTCMCGWISGDATSMDHARRLWEDHLEEEYENATVSADAINPAHYQGFSNGAEVIDISENLTSNAGQAVQYIARSCRLDGQIKDDPVQELDKAIWFLTRERNRIKETQ